MPRISEISIFDDLASICLHLNSMSHLLIVDVAFGTQYDESGN
ncbi:MAG: hypothetical protein QGI08_01200 [Paracoccaceae bacterium]|nr:hypothetical protein [Paracoccaceae bacterium]